MNATQKIKEFSRLVLLIIVMPILATVVFSKLVTSTPDFLPKSFGFSIRDPLAVFAEVKCDNGTCESPKFFFEGLEISRSLTGVIAFRALPEKKTHLEVLKNEMTETVDQFVDAPLCLSHPGDFATNLIIRNYQKEFITTSLKDNLFDIVFLVKGSNEKLIREKSDIICKKILGLLRSYFVSDMNPTHEQDVKKLKLVLGFYLTLTFLALFGFYLYPNFRNRFK